MKRVTLVICFYMSFCLNAQSQYGNTYQDAIIISHSANWEGSYNNQGLSSTIPEASCGSSAEDRWFQFNATSSFYKLDFINPSSGGLNYPKLSVWKLNLSTNSLEELECRTGSKFESFRIDANYLEVGQAYFIKIDGTKGLDYTLKLSNSMSNSDDYWQGATEIPHNHFFVGEYDHYGLISTLPIACGSGINKWFKFMASSDSVHIFYENLGGWYPYISLWEEVDGSLTSLICRIGDPNSNKFANVELNYSELLPSKEYYISIQNINPEHSQYRLTVSGGRFQGYWNLTESTIHPINMQHTIGIGTSTVPNSYILAVNGKAIMEEVKVQLSENWPDFVFDKDYYLRTLEKLEQHIYENGHLPDIPSEAEVTANGINLGEMNAKLLQKIEELTLYMIDMNKQMKSQNERVEQLETQNAELKNKIQLIENQ